MKHDTEQRLFILDPSWFYLVKWEMESVYSPETFGGDKIGLE